MDLRPRDNRPKTKKGYVGNIIQGPVSLEVHVGTSMNVLGAEELIRGPDALNRKKGCAREAEN